MEFWCKRCARWTENPKVVVRFHEIPQIEQFYMRSKVYKVSDEEFKKIIEANVSYSNCLRKLGLEPRGGSSTDILKRRIQELKCSTKHFNGHANNSIKNKKPLCEILIKNSNYFSINTLKKRLLKEGLIEYKCDCCGLTEWLDKPISLQLDHINGDNTDHRLENLRLLCPNCHSQTSTYAGKNAIRYVKAKPKAYCKKCGKELKWITSKLCSNCSHEQSRLVKRPDRNTFKQLVRTVPFTTLSMQFGISDVMVSKWCTYFGLPNKKSKIKKYSDNEWNAL